MQPKVTMKSNGFCMVTKQRLTPISESGTMSQLISDWRRLLNNPKIHQRHQQAENREHPPLCFHIAKS
jgi:hypothetical protein